ncbi:MAG TPA: matrixin family metalloprotease [Bryobacteraceae bacterium]|nr:matrixin family metalloprotease [Bryobacteraceae bacterium]
MRKLLPSVSLLLALAAGASARDISYWIAPCENPESRCKPGDEELARWALEAWEREAGGRIHFTAAAARDATFLMVWALPARGVYGETVPIEVNGQRRERMDLRVEDGFTKDRLLHDTIVYLTCVHESGHALGLAHTSNFDDIMYSFQYGGAIPEYFARFRRKLTKRDDIRKYSGISASDRARLLERLKSEAR